MRWSGQGEEIRRDRSGGGVGWRDLDGCGDHDGRVRRRARAVRKESPEMSVALVTGGSRGIGRAIVEEFAGAGYRVAFTFAASQEAAGALAGVAQGFQAD